MPHLFAVDELLYRLPIGGISGTNAGINFAASLIVGHSLTSDAPNEG